MLERLRRAAGKLWDRAGDWILGGFCLLLALFLYLQTLAPSVATLFDDSLEFPLVAHDLAIAHPTGYPLYTLLAKLFSLGPGPNVAWSVNLLSATAAALTVVFVYLIVRELGGRRLAALLGAVALMLSPVFWSQAVIAEVYTLASLFVVVLLWLALRWSRRPLLPVKPFSLLLYAPEPAPEQAQEQQEGPATRWQGAQRLSSLYRRFWPKVPPKQRLRLHPSLYLLVALIGLSLTHHRMTVLLAPALFLFVLLVENRIFSRAALLGPEYPERPRWRQIVGRPVVLLAACFFGPLLLYAYIPLRGQVGSLDGLYTNTWSGFWQWVLASGYGAFLSDNALARDLDATFYFQLFWRQFGPVGLALALVGVLGLLRRPKALVLTGLAFSTFFAFAVVYRVPDVEVFFVPAFLVIAIWIGLGLDYALHLLRIRGRSLAVRRLLAICAFALVLAAFLQPVLIGARSYPDLDLSRRWIVHDYGLYLLDQPLPENSTVVGVQGEMTLLRYFQHTEGQRPDIETVAVYDEEDRLQAVEKALSEGRSVFVTRSLPGLADRYSLGAVTGLIKVVGEPQALIRVGQPLYEAPELPRPIDQEVAPGLRLLGYGQREHSGHWQAWLRLRLWWQAPDGLAEPFQVSARLLDANGQMVAATDAAPVAWTYPPTAWRPGEVVADAYEIPLPAGLPAGEYRPLVIVYDPATGVEWGRVELEPVHLDGSSERPPHAALQKSTSRLAFFLFGDIELLGLTAPDPNAAYHPGDSLPLELLWQTGDRPTGDFEVTLWLETKVDEYPLATEALGGPLPADQWTAGQTLRQWLAPPLPDDLPPGTYALKMHVTYDGQPVPWSFWHLPLGSDLVLGTVQVE